MLARLICRTLLRQLALSAFCLALLSAGKSKPARIAMIAMTTSSSINVNPRVPGEFRARRVRNEERDPLVRISRTSTKVLRTVNLQVFHELLAMVTITHLFLFRQTKLN